MASGAHKDIPARLDRNGGLSAWRRGAGVRVLYRVQVINAPAADALGLTFKNNPKTDPTAAAIGAQFGVLLFRLAYLFLMSIAGSLIANKGINLYFSGLHGAPIHPPQKRCPSRPKQARSPHPNPLPNLGEGI